MASLTGNKGEWSEIYAFLRLLADGRVYAADEQLKCIKDMFFPIIKIIREENQGKIYEYQYHTGNTIQITLNNKHILTLPADEFKDESDHIFNVITTKGRNAGSFSVETTECFMNRIFVNKIKAPSSDKSDIKMQIHDINTGFEQIVGFSIKSELGSSPTLLNAGKTTNFIYKVTELQAAEIPIINAIKTKNKIIDRIAAIEKKGGKLKFDEMADKTFEENLAMIDSQMKFIVADMLFAYYSGKAKNCTDLLAYVIKKNPLSQNENFYKYKLKGLLCAIALGMKPHTPWDGLDEATGGYIVVKSNGEVLAYHIYNRDSFKGYILNNTHFDSPGTNRHDFARLYEKDGNIYIKLNLQIRFS